MFRPLIPSGLQWRLAAWIAVVILICTGVMFFVVYGGTGAQLRKQIDHGLSGDAEELASSLEGSGGGSPAQVAQAAGSYVRHQPFEKSSTLQFATVPGAGTSTNRPELFAQSKPDNGESLVQQDEENHLSGHLLTAPDGFSTVALPDVGNLRLLKRTVSVPQGPPVTIGVGEPLGGVAAAQRGVGRAFVLAGLIALGGALLGAYLIGTRLSRPLRQMAAVAARVDAGDLHPRIDDPGRQSEEVRVLADAFNHMLDRLTDAFAVQQAFVADASHELRTPLTVIRGQLEVLAAQPSPAGGEVRRVEQLVQNELARITRLVDDLLLLAKAEHTQFLRLEQVALADFVAQLWDGMSLLATRRFELDPVPDGTLRADPDRLAQALRNLIVNAIEHTAPEHGLVRMRVEDAGYGRIRFVVEDDGPGIPPAQRERVFDRFYRTDSARDRASGGAGLGLAIVRAVVEAHGGRVAAGRSPEGGARIELELPRFAPIAAELPARGYAPQAVSAGIHGAAIDGD
jgi:signal transduction histidine kinase